MSALGRWDIMNTLGDVQYIWGYHDACGGIPWVHWVMFSTSGDIMSTLGFSIEIERIYQVTPPNSSWYPLWCTEHPPNVLMIFPQIYSWFFSDILNIPQCTHGIPPFIMISPDVLNMPRCTHDIPHVLNIPYVIEHTLYRVKILWMNSLTHLKHYCDIFVSTMVTISEQEQYIWKQRKLFC